MTTRRNFLKYTVAAGTSLFLMGRVDLKGASAQPAARPAGRRSARYATASWQQSQAARWIPPRSQSIRRRC